MPKYRITNANSNKIVRGVTPLWVTSPVIECMLSLDNRVERRKKKEDKNRYIQIIAMSRNNKNQVK